MKKLLALLLACMMIAGCGKPAEEPAAQEEKKVPETTAAAAEPVPETYVSGHWGEKWQRSNGYTYPFEFDEPLIDCKGFTLEFKILEAEEGALDGSFRFEVYIQSPDGKWLCADSFQLEGKEKTMELAFQYPKDIVSVAVVCQKKNGANYNYSIGVRDVLH